MRLCGRLYRLVAWMSVLLMLAACGPAVRQVEIGERFELYPDETAVILGTDLRFQLQMVGHGWDADTGGEFGFVLLELDADHNYQTIELEVGDTWRVDHLAIHLWAADPFGENRCEFQVVRSE